jgi:hypothetical protein
MSDIWLPLKQALRIGSLQGENDRLRAENDRLRAGIQAFLDGDYQNPRANRPHPCRHGVQYYEECGQCNDEHFQALLDGKERE